MVQPGVARAQISRCLLHTDARSIPVTDMRIMHPRGAVCRVHPRPQASRWCAPVRCWCIDVVAQGIALPQLPKSCQRPVTHVTV